MIITDTCFLCNGEFTYDLKDKEPFVKFEFEPCKKGHIYCGKCVGVLNRQYNMTTHKDINLICPQCRYIESKSKSSFSTLSLSNDYFRY